MNRIQPWTDQWLINNGAYNSNTITLRFATTTDTTSNVVAAGPRELTDMEWLRAEVDSIRELAFA